MVEKNKWSSCIFALKIGGWITMNKCVWAAYHLPVGILETKNTKGATQPNGVYPQALKISNGITRLDHLKHNLD